MLILWNDAARGARRASELRRRLASSPAAELVVTRSALHATRAARAGARRHDVIVAAGGDGMIASVAGGLVGTRARLGILPLGTANDFARTLGIPLDPALAAEALASPLTRRLDVLELTAGARRRIVVNMIVVGNGARVTRRATKAVKSRWGPWSYMRGAAGVLRGLRRWRVRLTLGSRVVERVVMSVAFANGPTTAGGLRIAEHADPADGRIEIVTLDDAPPAAMTGILAKLVVGLSIEGDHVKSTRARSVDFVSGVPIPLSADGEHLGSVRKLSVRALPGALRVVTA